MRNCFPQGWRLIGGSLDFAADFVRGLYVLNGVVIFLCCAVFWGKRHLWRRRKRLGNRNPGFFPTFTSAGNALQNLQVIAQARAQYVIEEKLDDEADEDDEGEPGNPEKHLQRQLRRIRRGERIERLTALRRE
jgi:hypothetical protein